MIKGKVFMAYTYSPLHAGIGQTTGLVDLPIEREKHTGYPCVYATGLKGSLRSFWKQKYNNDNENLEKIFGKEDASSGAGGLIFTDLKILLFPVRASEGTFKWVTCQRILDRFVQDYKIATNDTYTLPVLQKLKALETVPSDIENCLLLEDFIFEKEISDTRQNESGNFLISEIPQKNVFLIDNDLFDYFVSHATQIIARNKLKKNKISDNLWYEEALPSDTLLYSFVKPSIAGEEDRLGHFLTNLNNQIIQVGGGETVGYGIVKLLFLDKKKEETL